ncbi:MAG: concanavalin A-like lectin/glucanase superfamily protein [Candidatus Saccharibacteria bacterium]|nr:concanavalin A-like lectin/glucanase superfamily protein [Candidatus Saccharibacteria bacterium]
MSVVAYAALLQANNSLNLAYKQAYIQMARVASKAAVDYAKEQFDNAACGNYAGTAEQNLVSNNRYRVTFRAEVTATSADGYEKTVKGTGSVYLPRQSATAQYVFDIRSEIVRTYALCKSPDNFAPTLWLDSSDPTTLKKTGSTTTTLTTSTSFWDLFSSTQDTMKERADDGTHTNNSWQSWTLNAHNCAATEFSSTVCNNNTTKYLNIGTVFKNVNIPKNATITSASLSLFGWIPSGSSGPVTHRVQGIYNTSANPHAPLFTQSGTNQIRGKLTDPALHTTAAPTFTTNNFPPGNRVNFDVSPIVQEIVNNPNWNPTGAGNSGRMGFALSRVSGNGSRNAFRDGVRLSITYTTTAPPAQTVNGDSVGQWNDKSGNGYNAIFTHGTAPTRVDSQINGHPIVRFAGGDMLSTLNTALSGKREMTVLAVMRPNFAGSSTDGRIISGMSSGNTSDTVSTTSIIPLMRNGGSNGFSNVYADLTSTNRTDYTCGGTCAGNPFQITSLFEIQNSSISSLLRGNGSPGAQKDAISPSTSTPPYTFAIDQLYIGGRRSGAMPGSGIDYMHGDFAEIVVYDKALTCRQIEALEEYMRAKWNTLPLAQPTTCPIDTIPTL